eukprot:1356673-Amorphochlora_amoeboformis.AAC.2
MVCFSRYLWPPSWTCCGSGGASVTCWYRGSVCILRVPVNTSGVCVERNSAVLPRFFCAVPTER